MGPSTLLTLICSLPWRDMVSIASWVGAGLLTIKFGALIGETFKDALQFRKQFAPPRPPRTQKTPPLPKPKNEKPREPKEAWPCHICHKVFPTFEKVWAHKCRNW